LQELRTLGWREGDNITVEYRWAAGRWDRAADLAAELVRLHVDVIVVISKSLIGAAQQATTTIPIVMSSVDDPVAEGFITSLARPGGNITGVDNSLMHTRAISAVIIYDPDRLSRNLGHQLLLAEELERAGVKLLMVSHPMEQGPEGWLFFQMRGALAEYERAKILERSRRGKIGRAKAGHPSGGRVPLGYRAVYQSHAGHWEVEPEEAALVERIFAMCLSGMPTRAIARQLTEERLPTKCDRHPEEGGNKRQARGVWSPQSVHQILTYQCYTGVAYWGKRTRVSKTTRRRESPEEWIQIPIPLIIDEATFQVAPRPLQRNKALAVRNRKHEYLLVGGTGDRAWAGDWHR
jgi:DNA invertase Pin-like site-specific DNA recombinase